MSPSKLWHGMRTARQHWHYRITAAVAKRSDPLPAFAAFAIASFAEKAEVLRWDKQVPVYAIIMNALIASMHISIGTFDSLVTFIGISDYSFFFFAVLAIFVLRRRETPLDGSYRTRSFDPVIFCIFSGFLVTRGVITNPLKGFAILFLTVIGWAVFKHRTMKS
ncbi:hypothetical protein ABVK25_008556 [Lepraria finkii]|uniref:Uncharacterized protein n=1 Tax=Lepraria finkii TaxID=1340010 RepID=A0ABR4AZQ6_9LECA